MTPGPLLHSLKHYKVLHERVCVPASDRGGKRALSVERRVEVKKLGKGFFEVKIRYGFFEIPNVPRALESCRACGLALEPDTSTFFLGRETWCPANIRPESWRIALYMWLASNALAPAGYFQLPPNRVVELGTQITI